MSYQPAVRAPAAIGTASRLLCIVVSRWMIKNVCVYIYIVAWVVNDDGKLCKSWDKDCDANNNHHNLGEILSFRIDLVKGSKVRNIVLTMEHIMGCV